MLRRILLAACATIGVLAAPHARAASYYLSSQTIGCPDVHGEVAVRRAFPFITTQFTLAQIVTIKQNGCTVLDANLSGTIVGSSGIFARFKPDGGWAPLWVRRGLLVAAKWADGPITDEKCYEQNGDDTRTLHEVPCR